MSLVVLVTCSEPDSRFSLGDLREDGDGKSPFFFFSSFCNKRQLCLENCKRSYFNDI